MGEAGLEPRSRRPITSPGRTPEAVEDQIIRLRKELWDQGLDAGAHTIAFHLAERDLVVPSVATIWRILSRRGFVTPQPQKRPRSSFIRFEADLPNERWQADVTHWKLADDTHVEILNVIDDHSRFVVASDALVVFKAADVVASFHRAASAHDFPASVLSDNGAVFTAAPRGGRCAMELETAALGISYRHSTPYHPQTYGKVERFHQTEKKWLAKHAPPADIGELQAQIDRFVAYYNEIRPHRALGRRTPAQAFTARPKARPMLPGFVVLEGYRNSDSARDLHLPEPPAMRRPVTASTGRPLPTSSWSSEREGAVAFGAGLGVCSKAEVLPGSAERRANLKPRNHRSGAPSEYLNPSACY